MTIQKVAVIGAGVMGAGIAAQAANAGCDVELLDRVDPARPEDPDAIAREAVERMAKTQPAPLMHKRNARRIRPGNTRDHMERLGDCDLVIEAVFEDPKVKFDIFQKIDAARRPGAIVASNTSTIPLRDLVAGQSADFRKHFVITHFFNPPRYMPLLELVTSPDNPPALVDAVTRFMDEKMGKGVVVCHDTPGFIANRIGTFWLQCAINAAYDEGLSVEEADALSGRPMGIPKTGVFGLIDLVGLDLMPKISASLLSKLPEDDGYVKISRTFPVIEKMIADGYTGRKGKGGFYRLGPDREKRAVDLETGAERPARRKLTLPALAAAKKKGIRGLIAGEDKDSQFAWTVLSQTLSYAALHAHDISGGVDAVDTAMRLGYNWTHGPFELIDKIGVDHFIARLEGEGQTIPPLLHAARGKSFYRTQDGRLQVMQADGSYAEIRRPEGVLLLSDIKRASRPVAKNISAALWDIGDGVLCLEFTSKMNALDFFSLRMMNTAADLIEKKGRYKALVIHNEGADFSVGANIGVALYAAKARQYWIIDKMVRAGQETYKRLKYAPFPVVAAPAGKALGGGCEILLHADHVQAHAETYPGLVEAGVGLLPAWGGCTELLSRAARNRKMPGGLMPRTAAVFEVISTAKVGLSAMEAKDLGYFRESDGITMNRQRLLADAKARALALVAAGYKPEEPHSLELPGAGGAAALALAVDGFYQKGLATPYDVVVADRIARVLTGDRLAGPGVLLTQDDVRLLERAHFMSLVRDRRTLARIETILKTGKPLREKSVAGVTAQQLRQAAPGHGGGFWARLFGGGNGCCHLLGKITPQRDTRARMTWPAWPGGKPPA